MKIENQVTSLEISKRLKELGVKQNSLFYWEYPSAVAGYVFNPTVHFGFREHDEESTYDSVSAFTVAELGEMLPLNIYDGRKSFVGFLMFLPREDANEHGEKWGVAYGHGTQDDGDVISTYYGKYVAQYADTEADARGKMLIYLLENNLLSVPK